MESLIDLRNRYADTLADQLRLYALRKNWDLSSVRVYAKGYDVKIDFGAKKYLQYVDQGTKPFLMHSLEGKIIPIGGGFRKVQGVGLPGIVSFERNGVMVHRMRWQKWRHPGIKPQHFIEQAYKAADRELGPSILRLRSAHSSKLILDNMLRIARSDDDTRHNKIS